MGFILTYIINKIMFEQSLILPAIEPNSMRKASSLHALKFKKITQSNE
jgi:hypothetical protein